MTTDLQKINDYYNHVAPYFTYIIYTHLCYCVRRKKMKKKEEKRCWIMVSRVA